MVVKPRVTVTIDELRLYGFDSRARRAIGDAVTRELAQRFDREPPAAHGTDAARVDGGSFALTHGRAPASLAAGVAERVHTAVRRRC